MKSSAAKTFKLLLRAASKNDSLVSARMSGFGDIWGRSKKNICPCFVLESNLWRENLTLLGLDVSAGYVQFGHHVQHWARSDQDNGTGASLIHMPLHMCVMCLSAVRYVPLSSTTRMPRGSSSELSTGKLSARSGIEKHAHTTVQTKSIVFGYTRTFFAKAF